MYVLKLTPAATLGLFIAHRNSTPKGIPAIRASLDADRVFIGEGGLLKPVDGGQVQVAAKDTVEVILENHVYDHLRAALTSVADEGDVFGFGSRKNGEARVPPGNATEADDALSKAEKRDQPASPRLVEGKGKKTG